MPRPPEPKRGSSLSINDRISRLASLTLSGYGTLPLAKYSYIGLGMTALVDYPNIDVYLDRSYSADGKRRPHTGETLASGQTQAAGVYPGYDRFGRLRKHVWLDGDATVNLTLAIPSKRALVDLTFAYDRASNRTAKYDTRLGYAPLGGASQEYDYDGLDRLKVARRGTGSGGGFSLVGGSQKWVLDQLGNWADLRTDIDVDGAFTTSGEDVETRTHDAANQLTARVVGGSTPTIPFRYDDAGNLHETGTSGTPDEVYIHDAWNRLVRVQRRISSSLVTVQENEYNALHWRVVTQEDTQALDADSSTTPNGLDRKSMLYYSAAWQVLETRVDEAYATSFVEDVRTQQFWGPRYIDEAIMYRSKPVAGAYGDGQYQLTDAQFSVVAVLDEGGGKYAPAVERVRYSPYGEATLIKRTDFNEDGIVDGDDLSDFIGAYYSSDPAADYDRNGTIASADLTNYSTLFWTQTAEFQPEAGAVSLRGNTAGYCGYQFNPSTIGVAAGFATTRGAGSGLYTVRFRTYAPGLGRWVERDPAGYTDGMALHQYVLATVLRSTDPSGLCASCGSDAPPPKPAIPTEICYWDVPIEAPGSTAHNDAVNAALHGVLTQLNDARRRFSAELDLNDSEVVAKIEKRCAICSPMSAAQKKVWKDAIERFDQFLDAMHHCFNGRVINLRDVTKAEMDAGCRCNTKDNPADAFVNPAYGGSTVGKTINLCPSFYKKDAVGQRKSMLNELTHVCLNTRDGGGSESVAKLFKDSDTLEDFVGGTDAIEKFMSKVCVVMGNIANAEATANRKKAKPAPNK